VTYTPATDYVGPDSFTYTVSDMAGGSATATVSVTVNPRVNQRPVAVDDSATTRMNTVVTIRVLDNDYDPDGTLNPATVRIVTQPRRGTVVVNGNGTGRVYYTPRLNFRGTDVFTYYVRDNDGMRSNTATVRVNVVR
jgi:hypothetical protein